MERDQLLTTDQGLRINDDHNSIKGHTMPAHKSTVRKKSGKDAIAVLKADHQRVRRLLDELEKTRDNAASKREKLLGTIETELKTHTRIEEEVFYPAFRESARNGDDRELYFEALEEHHVVDLVLPEIKGADPSSDQFAAKAKVLKDLVEHHAEEEESEMFPRARKLMPRADLMQLGQDLERAKEAAQTGTLGKLLGLVRP
jgi:hemerythrin superfamily protein